MSLLLIDKMNFLKKFEHLNIKNLFWNTVLSKTNKQIQF